VPGERVGDGEPRESFASTRPARAAAVTSTVSEAGRRREHSSPATGQGPPGRSRGRRGRGEGHGGESSHRSRSSDPTHDSWTESIKYRLTIGERPPARARSGPSRRCPPGTAPGRSARPPRREGFRVRVARSRRAPGPVEPLSAKKPSPGGSSRRDATPASRRARRGPRSPTRGTRRSRSRAGPAQEDPRHPRLRVSRQATEDERAVLLGVVLALGGHEADEWGCCGSCTLEEALPSRRRSRRCPRRGSARSTPGPACTAGRWAPRSPCCPRRACPGCRGRARCGRPPGRRSPSGPRPASLAELRVGGFQSLTKVRFSARKSLAWTSTVADFSVPPAVPRWRRRRRPSGSRRRTGSGGGSRAW